MVQNSAASTISQTHSGSGDNVQQKILVQIQALAPANLANALSMILASIRRRDTASAKIQLEMLRATQNGSGDVSVLFDVIAIYGELIEPDQSQNAFNAVSRIAASIQDDIVKDLCIAALLKFSGKVGAQEAAQAHYHEAGNPGPYSREAYYRHFATQAVLLQASKHLLHTEGELTGIIEGAIRLEAMEIAAPAAERLLSLYPSSNARVLSVITKAFLLNPEVQRRQYWLTDPELRDRIDELVEDVSTLIELSGGSDARLYDMAGPLLNYFQVALPTRLLEVCARYADYMEKSWPEVAARVRSTQGDDSALPPQMRALNEAQRDGQARALWCKARLDSPVVDMLDAVFFPRLASPIELEQWLAFDKPISNGCKVDLAVVKLLVRAQLVAYSKKPKERHKLGLQVDDFIAHGSRWFAELSIYIVVELADILFDAELPHKALALTEVMIPAGKLWPSPFVLLHLKCLLKTEQYQSFDDFLARIPDGDRSLTLMSYRSTKEEALGNHDRALALSDEMIRRAPGKLYPWLRGCQLRERFNDFDELRRFLDTIPDHIFEECSNDAVLIARYITSGGGFKRVEARLVKWFLEDPSARAIMLVNFHFGQAFRREADFEVSSSLPGCLTGVEFEQDGQSQIRLIVKKGDATGQYVLARDSQLADLLSSLEVGQSAPLGVVTYKLMAYLPPYVAAIRLAAQLRHLQNDGSDVFAILKLPNDPSELNSVLEQKLSLNQALTTDIRNEEIPLFIQGHALHSESPIRAALNAWADSSIPKSRFLDQGISRPIEIVLDAYSMAYLSMTNVVDRLLDGGMVFVLPAETKELLHRWVLDVTRDDFLMMGVDGSGRLVRTTASDVLARDGHTVRGLRRIYDESVVNHPVVHNTSLDMYSIKDGIDVTVYLAMQLSAANDLPWFCMDAAFAGLHHSTGYKIANVNRALIRAIDTPNFDFESKRHGLTLYALGNLRTSLQM
jgi:hypothetical protein